MVPQAAYLATDTLLVFDHLTRRIALLHAGSETVRLGLRREIMRRCAALAGERRQCEPWPGEAEFFEGEFKAAVERAKHHIRWVTCISSSSRSGFG